VIRIFSSKNPAFFGLDKKDDWIEVVNRNKKIPPKEKNPDDQVYLDISGLSQAELKKALSALRKSYRFCGIIDPKGSAPDPAAFFFEGCCDYIGPALIKKGLNKKRFALAFSWAAEKDQEESDSSGKKEAGTKKKIKKMPLVKFDGWKKIHSGTISPFFFLFASFSGKSSYRTMLGEDNFLSLKSSLREMLKQNLAEANTLLWMEAEESCLFLVPPLEENVKAVVEAVLRMLVNSKLIGIEELGLATALDFTFALHYGTTPYSAPGKTGAVISEAVNYIFHLGTKRAEIGRLTISDEVSEAALPEGLANLFSPAGVFEGISIQHSKRFIYK